MIWKVWKEWSSTILAVWKQRRGELQFIEMTENLYFWILVRTHLKWTNLLKPDKIILHNGQVSVSTYICIFLPLLPSMLRDAKSSQ